MGTTLHSFMDIFDAQFETDQGTVQLKQIVIPIIQRDYAQGRIDPDVNRVRSRFLSSLHRAVMKEPTTLDFVYGDIDANGIMTPLDGQQRLTTLFLLHWYAAKTGNIPQEKYVFLQNFSYKTRYSARYFCEELVAFEPKFSEDTLSAEIIDQAWFPLDWKKDQTISSMLVMLDAISEKFWDVPDLWQRLENNAITFYFLPIRDMGLTDELYIKMNSRGKPLTMFEHFKAELEREMRALDEDVCRRIVAKIDRDWTDLLWRYRDSGSGSPDDVITDDEFLRYFKFVCDVICYKNNESPQGQSNDEFDLLQKYFSSQNPAAMENLLTLEAFFDCWCGIPGYQNPTEFLMSFMAREHEQGKIIGGNKLDIFEDCLHFYSDKSGRTRLFPLNRIVLLYAITVYLRHMSEVTSEEFARRIRIVNNLIQNSEDEVSDRTDRNRLPAILNQVDVIILTGQIDESIENGFNVNQMEEEKEKIAFLAEHPESENDLFALEDHPMLKGQISIVGLNNLQYQKRFSSLFSCDWDKIDCAMMAMGNYGQRERNRKRFQFASKSLQIAWDQLFHKSKNIIDMGFEKTSEVLLKLLDSHEEFTDEILGEIAETFIASCEAKSTYPWRYYYVKYPEFRPGSYGKMSCGDFENAPYLFSVMQTKSQWSSNTYVPYLKIADEQHLSREEMGQRLAYREHHIICKNASYELRTNEGEEVIDILPIQQDETGTDREDRVLKLKAFVAALPQ